STGLDYTNGKYVAHPTPEDVKKELGKTAINLSYLDKTLVLKNSFHVVWRILFTFVIQVLGGNYSFTEQVNSIQQLLAYCLITGTQCSINDPFPSTDETEQRPLKEFLIKFSVLNGQRPLNFDFNTFYSSTGLDYTNGKYVAHPTPEDVKKELGKTTINLSYLDKTLVLKNSFHVVWRILFTFVIQVLGGNYSFTEQVNSIQQLLAYCLITGTQ
nr:hypothetical protein [Tanacetum cinerariifolium]